MKITMLALGSRGDVQPFVALGLTLQARGHAVRIAAAADYENLAADHGLAFTPVGGYVRDQMDFAAVGQMLDAAPGAVPVGMARQLVRQVRPLAQRIFADCWRAAQDADLLLASTLGCFPGCAVAERRGVPLVPAHLHPASATSLAPDVSFPTLALWGPLRAGYNRLTHALAAHGLWQLLRDPFNEARQTVLGLPPLSPVEQWRRVRRDADLVLYGYSELVAPRPADWDRRLCITGYWFLEHSPRWQPPAALVEFLAAGPPPVYVGFGSVLAGSDPDGLTALVIAALRATGQRGVLFRGWGDFARGTPPPDMIAVDSVPHDWLFPQMAAVVTHGGAGTVAYALRAGVPVVVTPVYGDQPFWGRRVAALGAGPPPLPRRSLTAASLAHALGSTCAEPGQRPQALQVGAHLAAEHGTEAAAAHLERYHVTRAAR